MAATSMPVRDAGGNLRDVAQEENGGIRTPRFAPEVGGAAVSPSNPMPVQGPLTDAQMRAAAIPTADAGLGTDGAAPPVITGTGVRGWLRAIYERLTGTLAVSARPATAVSITVVALPAGQVVQVAAANTGRRLLSIVNVGLGRASMDDANTVADGSGWPLMPAVVAGDQGGGYGWDGTAVPSGALWAVSATGTTLCVMEA